MSLLEADGRAVVSGGPRTVLRWVSAVVVATLLVGACASGSQSPGSEQRADQAVAWWQPFSPETTAPLGSLCDVETCVDDVVVRLGSLVLPAVDMAMVEPWDLLTVERVWTGTGNGVFGSGWQTPWDVRVVDGVLRGPLPATPLSPPNAVGVVTFDDGSEVTFDGEGRPRRWCRDGSLCADATWTLDGLVVALSDAPQVSVTWTMSGGVVSSVVSHDGRRVEFTFEQGRLSSARSATGEERYRYDVDGVVLRRSVDAMEIGRAHV